MNEMTEHLFRKSGMEEPGKVKSNLEFQVKVQTRGAPRPNIVYTYLLIQVEGSTDEGALSIEFHIIPKTCTPISIAVHPSDSDRYINEI